MTDPAAINERRALRRKLTGHALQGLLSSMEVGEGSRYIGIDELTADNIGREAVMVAEAAINALADVEQMEEADDVVLSGSGGTTELRAPRHAGGGDDGRCSFNPPGVDE